MFFIKNLYYRENLCCIAIWSTYNLFYWYEPIIQKSAFYAPVICLEPPVLAAPDWEMSIKK